MIKILILDKNENYLNKLIKFFNVKYSDKLEIYSFVEYQKAITLLEETKIDIFLVSDYFDVDIDSIPRRCSVVYLCDTANIELINGVKAICKYQNVDLIYKQILNIYSDNASIKSIVKPASNLKNKIICFNSIGGGSGASTISASCAMYYARLGKKTLYLNLEKFGSSDVFFYGDGQFNMSDVILALKSKKSNLAIKFESYVKKDKTGVNFFSSAKIALDMLELTIDDITTLISELKDTYEVIVIDSEFTLDKEIRDMFNKLNILSVWVSDSSEMSITKLNRVYESIAILESNENISLLNSVYLLYNKYNCQFPHNDAGLNLRTIGNIKDYEYSSIRQLLDYVSSSNIFGNIL